MITDLICEAVHRDPDGLHLCGRTASHEGGHVCASVNLCGVRWRPVIVVVSEHLGPCARWCGENVRAGTECSTCLEDAGTVYHERCCVEGGTVAVHRGELAP